MRWCFVLIAVMAMAPLGRAETTDPIENGLVQVIVTYQDYDPLFPWQKRPPGLRNGYGVVVQSNRVIVTESLVRNQTLVELRRVRQGEKISARVELADPEVNLALLRFADPDQSDGLTPLPLSGRVERKDKLDIFQFDETSQLQKGEGKVLQINMTELPRAPYQSLQFSLLTDLNVNGEGAPVVTGGKLAGLVMTYNAATRIGIMIPYPIIESFLHHAAQPVYPGFAAAGFTWTGLIDPAKRAYLKVTTPGKGIQVLSCLPATSACTVLKPNDVILDIDGYSIDNLGFYHDADFGRLPFAYIIKGRHVPGEVITLTLIRDATRLTVPLTLCRWSDKDKLIPENVTGEPMEYLIDGGFIISELTGRYLREHGPNRQRLFNSRLVHTYLTRTSANDAPGQRIVILTTVLPDPINIGYQQFRNEVITRINGHPVSNMADVFRTVDAEGHISRVTLQSLGIDLVMDTNLMATANGRLATQYRIPKFRYQAGRDGTRSQSPHITPSSR